MAATEKKEVAVAPLVLAYAGARSDLADRMLAELRRLLEVFTGWYVAGEVAALGRRIAALVESCQRLTAALTNAYLARSTALMGQPAVSVPIVNVSELRAGVDHAEAYERLAVEYRYQVSEGKTADEALQRAVTRAEVMATTDTSLAMREQSRAFMTRNEATGYRRIIHPEMSKGGTCGLCAVASDRRYSVDELMPIHGRCECTVLPIFGGRDPGHKLNKADLKALYESAGGTAAEDLKRTRYAVQAHSELGPVLVASTDSKG